MKKALYLLMCFAFGMVTLSLRAAKPQLSVYTSIDFSTTSLWGETPRYGLPDTDGSTSYFWYYFGDYGNSSKMRDHDTQSGDPLPYNAFDKTGNAQPTYMSAGQYNRGFLDFFNDEPLARTFEPVGENGRSKMVEIPDSGLFVDSLVKFVARNEPFSSVPTDDVDGKAKFMVWLSVPEGSSTSNLVVTAGRLDSSLSPYRANYLTTAKVETNRWYRLTARVIANAATADGEKVTAFALYLDGEQVVCDSGDYAVGDDPAQMETLFAGNEHFARCGLFPSILPARSKSGIYGVAVQGEGAIDEIGLVDDGNPLIGAKPSSLITTVAADVARISSISCTVTAAYSAKPYFATNVVDASSVSFETYGGATICVYPKVRAGYALLDELAVSGNSAAVQSVSGYAVTLNSDQFSDDAGLTLRINTREAFYRVGDSAYETFDEAQEAAQEDPSRTLSLEVDVTLDPDSEQGQMRVVKASELVIDLCGHRIKGENFLDEAAIYNQGRLTVVDTVGGGSIEASGTAIETVSANDALEVNYSVARLTMGDEAATNAFQVLGRVRVTDGELVLKAGDYLTPPGEDPETFYLGSHLAPNRFSAVRYDVAATGTFWRVLFDGRVKVSYYTPVGTVTPESEILAYNSTANIPTLVAPGYQTDGWYEAGSETPFDFSTPVTNDLKLTASVEAIEFTIENDFYESGFPTSYRVTDDLKKLPVPSKRNYAFGGWRDEASGRFVESVGKGAMFVGTGVVVTGNLDLVSIWTPTAIVWENTAHDLIESNGVYAGSWSFTLPAGVNGLAYGKKVAIDEIAFCVVNPLLYPKTSPRLAFVNGSEKVISDERTYEIDTETDEYTGVSVLKNGRAKVAYKFTGLEMRVGLSYELYFCDASGAQASGFLRLTPETDAEYRVIGPCSGASPAAPIERYADYAPMYEISGHDVEEDDE